MKTEQYPNGIAWAILHRATALKHQLRCPHVQAVEAALCEFLFRSTYHDRERARAELEYLIAQCEARSGDDPEIRPI